MGLYQQTELVAPWVQRSFFISTAGLLQSTSSTSSCTPTLPLLSIAIRQMLDPDATSARQSPVVPPLGAFLRRLVASGARYKDHLESSTEVRPSVVGAPAGTLLQLSRLGRSPCCCPSRRGQVPAIPISTMLSHKKERPSSPHHIPFKRFPSPDTSLVSGQARRRCGHWRG